MTPGQRLPRASAQDPGGRAGHVMRDPATGPARPGRSRTGSGHGRCPARRLVAPVPRLARAVTRARARAPARTPVRAPARTPVRAPARTPVRALAPTPARAVARTPALAAARAPARTRCAAAPLRWRRSMARHRDGKAIPAARTARPRVTARMRPSIRERVTARAAVTAHPAGTSGTPATVRPAAAARQAVPRRLTTPNLGRRRPGSAGAAATPGRDSSRLNLAKRHRAVAVTRPAAG
jgi:hypothetical protein